MTADGSENVVENRDKGAGVVSEDRCTKLEMTLKGCWKGEQRAAHRVIEPAAAGGAGMHGSGVPRWKPGHQIFARWRGRDAEDSGAMLGSWMKAVLKDCFPPSMIRCSCQSEVNLRLSS